MDNSTQGKKRVIFAGTSEFAAEILSTCMQADFSTATGIEIIAVYTQPDRKAGRGLKLRPSPVKEVALVHQLPIEQPPSLRDPSEIAKLSAYQADLILVVAYGLLLPAAVLAIPRLGCINIHASLLPRWRGAAPIQRAILTGDEKTGVCLMQMDEGLDTGAVISCKACPIADDDTTASLSSKLQVLATDLLREILPLSNFPSIPQAETGSSYAAKIDKSEAIIDWSKSAAEISRLIRAFNPSPGAVTNCGDLLVKIWQAELGTPNCSTEPGKIINWDKKGLEVATGQGTLVIQKIQLPGSNIVKASDFFASKKAEIFKQRGYLGND